MLRIKQCCFIFALQRLQFFLPLFPPAYSLQYNLHAILKLLSRNIAFDVTFMSVLYHE